MPGPVIHADRHGPFLLTFLLLTFLVSWSFFAAGGVIPGAPGGLFFLLGTIAPSLVALALTERFQGRDATRALLRRAVQWQVGARWYLFALSYMAAVKLAVALVHRVVSGDWPQFGQEAWYVMGVAIIFSTPVQAGEEIGWRGYALPRLAARMGLAPASLVLGAIWALWHLPLFFVPEADTSGQSFPVYLLQVTALSVAMAWLWWRTGGSLLLVMLMHAAVNNTKDIVPSAVAGAASPLTLNASLVAWLTVTLLWAGAVCFLIQMRSSGAPAGRARQRYPAA